MSSAVAGRQSGVLRPNDNTKVVLLRGGAEVATWTLSHDAGPALSLVDDLARLQLVARRLGYSIQLRDAPGPLRALLDLVGLAEVVTSSGPLAVEVGGEPELGEEVRVEEAVEPGDPVA